MYITSIICTFLIVKDLYAYVFVNTRSIVAKLFIILVRKYSFSNGYIRSH